MNIYKGEAKINIYDEHIEISINKAHIIRTCKGYVEINIRGCPRGVMVKAMDCGIVVSEFVLQSCYYIHFRANTLGKCMNPFMLPAIG